MTARKVSKERVQQFEKDKAALKYYLIGKGYTESLYALGLAERYHTGARKGGDHELHHQVRICFTLISLKGIEDEQAALTAMLYHDVMEDYDIDISELKCREHVAEAAWRLTKKHRGEVKSKARYLKEIAEDPIASIGKGADRLDNISDAPYAFTLEKLAAYIVETRDEILPILKKASKLHPHQHIAYASLSALIKRAVHSAEVIYELRKASGEHAAKAVKDEQLVRKLLEELSCKVSELSLAKKQKPELDLTTTVDKLKIINSLATVNSQAARAALLMLTEEWKLAPSAFAPLTPGVLERATAIPGNSRPI